MVAKAELVGSFAVIKDPKVRDKLFQKGFGELSERKLLLDWCEVAFLAEKHELEVFFRNRKLAPEEIVLRAVGKDKKAFLKYVVYKDLRNKGYVAKGALKFGFALRVYPKGKRPGEAHTEFVVSIFREDEKISTTELSRMVRLSRTLNAGLLLAIVDSEGNINYYSISRKQL